MKKTILFLLTVSAIQIHAESPKLDKFLKVIAQIESSNNPKAYNPKENAIGLYQIRPAYFKDAQASDKSLLAYRHKDCFNPSISRLVVKAYIHRYHPTGTLEEWAELHNSGPKWKNKKHLTKPYLNKFKKINLGK